jgi:1,2-diacylglycerol 3-beta-galactosyltransferase
VVKYAATKGGGHECPSDTHEKKKRILFLLSDTGGGHRSAAQAITEAITELYPHEFEITQQDIFQQSGCWPITQIPKAYAWCTNSGLPLWQLFWSYTSHPIIYKSLLFGLLPIFRPAVQRHFTTFGPDIVISVHPCANHIGLRLLQEARLDCPFVTVVTDLTTFHPAWIEPEVSHCFVSTDIARTQAIVLGLAPYKVTVCGQPVSPRFITPTGDKQTARQNLGLETACPTILLTGGGEGDNRLFAIAQRLADCAPHLQLLVVAGRNHHLKARLGALTWPRPPHIYGFVDNMPELMRAADIVITRAGPGTISEALVVGLPVILYGYIPGQEEGNIAYIQEHRAGVYLEQPGEIAQVVLDWTSSQPSQLAELAHHAARLAYPGAAYRIANQVYDLI